MSAKKKGRLSAETVTAARTALRIDWPPIPPPSIWWQDWFRRTPCEVAELHLEVQTVTNAIHEQRAKFEKEQAALKRKAAHAMDIATVQLARRLDAISEAERESNAAQARLKRLTEAVRNAEQKILDAEVLREQLERALADLRAYPSAKIEAWNLRRQEMDPKAEPRFPAIEAAP